MAKDRNSPCRHGEREQRAEKLSITFHLQHPKAIGNEFGGAAIKSVGGVCSNTRRARGGKASTSIQDGGLPVRDGVWLQEAFLCMCTCCTWPVNFMTARCSGRRGLSFEIFKGALLSRFGTNVVKLYKGCIGA